MENTSHMISLDTARALVARGWSVVPTAGDEEKRPLGTFATAKSWRDFSERLPTDAELLGWFGPKPRRGGVVLHKGQLCVDRDTKEILPDGNAPWEETTKGSHEFFRCDPEAKIAHDHEAKIDYLTWGSFVRLCDPRCLIDWAGELPEWGDSSSGSSSSRKDDNSALQLQLPTPTLLETLKAQGWQVGSRASNGWFSLTNGSKTAAISADGSTLKMFSTTMQESPTAPAPQIVSAADLAKESPPLAEPVLSFCRRGSFALLSGDPKAGKTTLALKICAKKAAEGLTCLYADFENGPALFWHRLEKLGDASALAKLHYLDCRYSPTIDYIASAMREIGKVDVLVIDCWGLLIAGDGVEDESSNALVSAYFLKVRRTLAEFNAATVILHHTPKSGANEKLCFAGAGASSLQRYVQTIARIGQDKAGAYWFNALCREFDDPFKPVLLRKG